MSLTEEIAAAAARLVVEEGLEYGPAKRRAAKALGRTSVRGAELPSNDAVEDAVREYLELFCADIQPLELATLRAIAWHWMQRLAEYRPHLNGAVWRGTATRHSAVHLDLYCDDEKGAEIGLINLGIAYDAAAGADDRTVLHVGHRSTELGTVVPVLLTLRDHDELRGALKPDARGRSPRGDLAALQKLLDEGLT